MMRYSFRSKRSNAPPKCQSQSMPFRFSFFVFVSSLNVVWYLRNEHLHWKYNNKLNKCTKKCVYHRIVIGILVVHTILNNVSSYTAHPLTLKLNLNKQTSIYNFWFCEQFFNFPSINEFNQWKIKRNQKRKKQKENRSGFK